MLKLFVPLLLVTFLCSHLFLFVYCSQPEFSPGQKQLKHVNQMSLAALILVQGAAITMSKGRERDAWAIEAVRVGVLDAYKASLRQECCQEMRSSDKWKRQTSII